MNNTSKHRQRREEFEIKSEGHSLLLTHRIKVTSARLAVINILLDAKSPLLLGDIIKKSKGHSAASVYRTLDLLVTKGILHVINTGNPTVAYELMHGKRHHHHMICTGCGILEDVKDCSIKDTSLKMLANSEKFSSLSHHSLEFFGMCNSCSKS